MSDGSDSGIPTPIDNIGCQELLEKSCSHSGWLRKRHGILNNSVTQKLFDWPQAYVVLSDSCLYYFRNEKAKSASGKFSLYGYNSVVRASEIAHKDAPWAFKLMHTHKEFKSYYFSASCEKEMKKWMQSVKAEMLKANSKNFSSYYMYGVLPLDVVAVHHVGPNFDDGNFLNFVVGYNKDRRDVTKPEKSDLELNNDKFYEDIEVNIYEDIAKCKLPKNYSKNCSVKKDDEDSDDDNLDNDATVQCNGRNIADRKPMPLPDTINYTNIDTRAPLPLPRPPDMEPPPSFQYKSVHKVTTGEVPENKPPLSVRRGKNKEIVTNGIFQPTETTEITTANEEKEENITSTDYWGAIYFNDGTAEEASEIIASIAEDGVYLVRPETQGEGKVLVVYSLTETRTKKFRIKKEVQICAMGNGTYHLVLMHQCLHPHGRVLIPKKDGTSSKNGRYFLQKEGPSEKTVEALLNQYYDIFLPTVKLKLTLPYKLHEKYKELKKI